MKKIAVFPGSFDPFTKGHEDVMRRALPLFDHIIIAIGNNSQKNYLFDLQKRISMISQTFNGEAKVTVQSYNGLTVEFCGTVGAGFILRGLRNSSDFQFEKNIAQMNQAMQAQIETVFLMTHPALSAISSTIVRDIYNHGGDIRPFIPSLIQL